MNYTLCEITRELCENYFLHPSRGNESMNQYSDDNLIFIGTGKHQIFTSRTAFEDVWKNYDTTVSFDILSEWYECQQLSEYLYLVYGCLWVKEEENSQKEILIEMDTRISIIYEVNDKGCKILHIHHSVPYAEQGSNEHYPKTLSEKANFMIDMLKQKVDQDSMTGLLNRNAFEQHITKCIKSNPVGIFYMIDIDNFKQINDTYGHVKGDTVITDFANLLSQIFNSNAYISRLGGDEFAVFEPELSEEDVITHKAQSIINGFSSLSSKYGDKLILSCSIGISFINDIDCSFKHLYHNADEGLYLSKKNRGGSYHVNKNEDI